MFTVETKNLLAKLMATENITVQHSKVRTAKFNLTHRILTCPVWKYMDGDLYDLLMGHEISHALHTPPKGWHDTVVDARSQKKKAFKHFLNVIEDARIEALIKKKYPGLKQPMQRGYRTLLAKDFFGTSVIENFNDVYLIDKLNISAKLGTAVNIRFTDQEKPFYDEMMRLETWEQVVDLSLRVYEYSKKEQEEGEKKKKEMMRQIMEEAHEEEEEEEEEQDGDEYEDDYEEYEEEYGDGDGDEEGEGGDAGEEEDSDDEQGKEKDKKKHLRGNRDNQQDEQNQKGGNQSTPGNKDEETGKDTEKIDGDKKKDKNKNKSKNDGPPDHGTEGGEFIPRAKTDEVFREREKDLIETTDVEEVYVKIPTPNLSHILVPSSRVNYGITSAVLTDQDRRNKALQLYADFRRKNHDYIMLLVKEFEMRKAARSFQKRRICETGDIDTKKISRYLLDDDIFKKLMMVQKGKSHGLVLLLDKSGSMSGHIKGAMEQILVFAMFCRKVNIPFIAFSFTDTQLGSKEFDFPNVPIENLKPFSRKTGEMVCKNVDIRELFNSKMPAHKFTQAIINHLVIADILSHRLNWDHPNYEKMGGTPLNEAIIALRDVAKRFKELNKLDIVNMVIVHDGDSDASGNYYTENRDAYSDAYRSSSWGTKSFIYGLQQVTLVDENERLNIRVARDDRKGLTQGLMKWFQMTSGVGVFGFFIVDGKHQMKCAISSLYTNKNGIAFDSCDVKEDRMVAMNKLLEQFNEQKYLESYALGYTRFYLLVGGGDLIGDAGMLQDTGKTWTPSRLLTAFKKIGKKKHVSRVLVSKFIELISTHE